MKKLNPLNWNKRGMIFTILVIAILSLFLVSYSVYSYVQDRDAINKRIKSMNNYVFSLEEDLHRKVYISGYRIILIFQQKVTQEYIVDLDSKFHGLFFDGMYNGDDYVNDNDGIMAGAIFEDIENDIIEKAKRVNLDVSLSNPEVSISQDDPWNVKVSLTTDLLIEDQGNLAKWKRTAVIDTYIPIKNFEDPYYIKHTNGLVANKFIQSPYDISELWEIEKLKEHTQNSYYIASSEAPNFLQRFEGKFLADPDGNGIESLVYLPDMNIQELIDLGMGQIPGESIVDYLYFNEVPDPGEPVVDMDWEWFKLDPVHKGFYGVG